MTTTRDEPKSNGDSARAWALLLDKLNSLSSDLREERQATSQAQTALWKRSNEHARCLTQIGLEIERLKAALKHTRAPLDPVAVVKWLLLVVAALAVLALAVAVCLHPELIPVVLRLGGK